MMVLKNTAPTPSGAATRINLCWPIPLNKVIALRWIAEWRPPDDDVAAPIRQAILEERWSDAVLDWMEATGEVLDIFPFGLEIHEARDYPDEEFGPRVQTTPLFRGQ